MPGLEIDIIISKRYDSLILANNLLYHKLQNITDQPSRILYTFCTERSSLQGILNTARTCGRVDGRTSFVSLQTVTMTHEDHPALLRRFRDFGAAIGPL